jgi:hypothetical protein
MFGEVGLFSLALLFFSSRLMKIRKLKFEQETVKFQV